MRHLLAVPANFPDNPRITGVSENVQHFKVKSSNS